MKTRVSAISVVVLLLCGGQALAKPLDVRALECLDIVSSVVKSAPHRSLTSEEKKRVLEFARADGIGLIRQAAAYALLFTHAPESATALKALSADSDPSVSETAQAVLLLKSLGNRFGKREQAILAAALGKDASTWKKRVLTSHIGREHGKKAVPLLLQVLTVEADHFVRHECLHHILRNGDPQQIEAVEQARNEVMGPVHASEAWRQFEADVFLRAVSQRDLPIPCEPRPVPGQSVWFGRGP